MKIYSLICRDMGYINRDIYIYTFSLVIFFWVQFFNIYNVSCYFAGLATCAKYLADVQRDHLKYRVKLYIYYDHCWNKASTYVPNDIN